MKVLIVIDSLGTGGAQKLKAQIAKGLVQRGHEVEIFIYNSDNQFFAAEFVNAGIKIHIADKQESGFSFGVLLELRALIKSQYDAVISSLHAPSIYAALAVLGNKNCKLIVCEESSSNAPVPLIRKVLFYFATLFADAIVANSFNEARLMTKLPGRSKKLNVIWNGYELGSISFKPRGISQNLAQITLLVVGRVAYPKNGTNLLKGLKLFSERNGWMPKVNWVGRRDTDPKSVEMQKEMDLFLLQNTDVAKSWVWCGEVRDVEKYYQLSDALLHVSRYEGLPMVICEAMLSGCFVIASDVCDHPLLLGNEERGLLCDPLSPESICEAIERFTALKSESRMDAVKRARQFAELEFDRKIMVDKFEGLLNTIRE